MTVFAFEEMVRVPGPAVYGAGAAGLGLAALAAKALEDRFSLDLALASPRAKLWGAAAWAVCAVFVWAFFRPLLPAKVFGLVYWPARVEGAAALAHLVLLGALGCSAFFMTAGLAGVAGGEAAPPPSRWAELLAAGALTGAALGVVGIEAGRALFVADALSRLGFRLLGGLLLGAVVPAAAAAGALLLFAAARGGPWGRRWRWGAAAGALAVWLVPVSLTEGYLRLAWDFGRPGLAEAAGVAKSASAPHSVVVVLAREAGAPGWQRREEALSVEGLAVSREGLEAVRRYLEVHGYRTIFLKEALAYLRRGWQMLWEPERHMDAAMIRLGPRFPPDYDAFLSAIRVAPATPENYDRLENMARAADKARSPSVRRAGHLFQGLSAAYARFGDLSSSNLWLDRIQRLWPLYEDEVSVDPIEERHEGVITGSVLFNGRPASAVQVGLFMLASSSAPATARGGLTAAAWPDASGRFEFKDLTPGRYYLALRGDPVLLGDGRLDFWNAPGLVRLRPDAMREDLFPIEVVRGVGNGETAPMPRSALPGLTAPFPQRTR